jgi:hypothetical protein
LALATYQSSTKCPLGLRFAPYFHGNLRLPRQSGERWLHRSGRAIHSPSRLSCCATNTGSTIHHHRQFSACYIACLLQERDILILFLILHFQSTNLVKRQAATWATTQCTFARYATQPSPNPNHSLIQLTLPQSRMLEPSMTAFALIMLCAVLRSGSGTPNIVTCLAGVIHGSSEAPLCLL